MKTFKYSIQINKPVGFVFDKIRDKSIYPEWAKAWGEGMTYEGEWREGDHISFFDKTEGGTKVIVEEIVVNKHIKTKHIAMVNPQNIEIELTDDAMKKWVGSKESYFFKKDGDETTTLEVVMEADESFKEMMDVWDKALVYFKEACEKG